MRERLRREVCTNGYDPSTRTIIVSAEFLQQPHLQTLRWMRVFGDTVFTVGAAAVRSEMKVLVPAEHGAWGFLAEPLLLGLLVAFSTPGLALAAAVTAGFLVRHPLKLALGDRAKGKRYPRTETAERAVAALVPLAVAGMVAAVAFAGPRILLPAALASPAIGVALHHDLRHKGRSRLAEIAAPVGLSWAAASIALAGGWDVAPALALWGLLVARGVPSVLYVRARLRLERGEPVARGPAEAAQGVALLGAAWLAGGGLLPWLSTAAIAVLAGRAFVGLSSLRRPVTARQVGFTELGLGILTVLATAVGHWGGC